MSTVKTNFTKLRALQRYVGELETARVQVGLFKATSGRSADAGRIQDNPSLGFVHEFGSTKKKIPERSFLRMPLTLHLGKLIEAKGASWLYLLFTRGVKRTLAFLGALGEDVVQEAFATRGYGSWPELKAETVRRKKSSAILIESAQMRKAVAYRVI